jgi:uncharacterized membrane protein YphA (DoxX/SURF4 family)
MIINPLYHRENSYCSVRTSVLDAIGKNMKRLFNIIKHHINLILRIALGSVFLFAGVAKLIHPGAFFQNIRNILDIVSDLPYSYAFAIGYVVVCIEIILGLLVLISKNKKVLYASMMLITLFCFILVYKIATHDTTTCGCYGKFIIVSNQRELVNNVLLLAIAYYLL